MKITSVFRRQILIIAFIFILLPSFSLSIPAPGITLSPFTEVFSGEAREHVYFNDKILSELVWDMKPMITAGLGVQMEWTDGLRIEADASAGFPVNTGAMEDSDWLNLLTNGRNVKTTFSAHDADLEYSYLASVKAGWDIPLPFDSLPFTSEKIRVIPRIGFRYMTWKWNGKDGYVQHPDVPGSPSLPDGIYQDWNEGTPKSPAKGTVISYSQEYFIPTAGISVSVPVGTQFRLDFGFTGSLWVTCTGTDHHFIPTSGWDFTYSIHSDLYIDSLSGGYFGEGDITLRWKAMPRIVFFLEGKITGISDLRGATYGKQYPSTTYIKYQESNGGGADLNTFSLKLGIETKIR